MCFVFRPTYAGDNLGLAAELADMEEDVVVDDDDQIESRWTAVPAMKSEPLNKVFVEKQSKNIIVVLSASELTMNLFMPVHE